MGYVKLYMAPDRAKKHQMDGLPSSEGILRRGDLEEQRKEGLGSKQRKTKEK